MNTNTPMNGNPTTIDTVIGRAKGGSEEWWDHIVEEAKTIADRFPWRSQKELEKKIPIVEVFGPTVQGEGMLIGQPTMFIRTGLCDYRCTRCDSLHAVDPALVKQNAKWVTQPELIAVMHDTIANTPLITLSGGNPCIHDLSVFIEGNQIGLIGKQRRAITVETQGSRWTDWLLDCEFVTISPKGPGMGEQFEPQKFDEFLRKLGPGSNYRGRWCIKVPVFDQRDIELVVSLMDRWPATRSQMYISLGNVNPPDPALRDHAGPMTLIELREEMLANYERMLNIIMNDHRLNNVSILPQLHTLIWGNEQCR